MGWKGPELGILLLSTHLKGPQTLSTHQEFPQTLWLLPISSLMFSLHAIKQRCLRFQGNRSWGIETLSKQPMGREAGEAGSIRRGFLLALVDMCTWGEEVSESDLLLFFSSFLCMPFLCSIPNFWLWASPSRSRSKTCRNSAD